MKDKTCQDCHVGHFQPAKVAFVHSIGSRMMTLPNAPAFRCDMCGQILFDPGFLITMRYVLAQMVSDSNQPAPRRAPAGDRTRQWSQVRRSG